MSLDYRTLTDEQIHRVMSWDGPEGGLLFRVRSEMVADMLKRLDEDDRWRVAITLACKRWGWEHCTTEVELIAQIDRLIGENETLGDAAMGDDL